jgi:hypothetical protein
MTVRMYLDGWYCNLHEPDWSCCDPLFVHASDGWARGEGGHGPRSCTSVMDGQGAVVLIAGNNVIVAHLDVVSSVLGQGVARSLLVQQQSAAVCCKCGF